MQINLDRDSQLIVTRGKEAWKTLRADETFEKWIAIGRAIEAGKQATLRMLNTGSAKGRVWSETFGQWLKETEFDQIDKGVRSRLQACVENLPAIEAWRQTIGLTLRLQLNHPNAVLRRWQAWKQKQESDGKDKPPSPSARKDARIEELESQIRTLQAKLHILESDNSGEIIQRAAAAVQQGEQALARQREIGERTHVTAYIAIEQFISRFGMGEKDTEQLFDLFLDWHLESDLSTINNPEKYIDIYGIDETEEYIEALQDAVDAKRAEEEETAES